MIRNERMVGALAALIYRLRVLNDYNGTCSEQILSLIKTLDILSPISQPDIISCKDCEETRPECGFMCAKVGDEVPANGRKPLLRHSEKSYDQFVPYATFKA